MSPRIVEQFDDIVQRLRRTPGVTSASAITWLPMNNFWSEWRGFTIEGRAQTAGNQNLGTGYNPIATDFFRTMRIPLVDGRDFNEHDGVSAPWVVIINEAAARTFWKNENPIGSRITLEMDDRPRQVIGIIRDVKHYDVRQQVQAEIYVPHAQQPAIYRANRTRGRLHMSFVIRTQGGAAQWTPALRQALSEIEKRIPVYALKPMDEYIAATMADSRLYTTMLSIFGGIAVLLALIGVYGVFSYTVAQRTPEIGLRIALGAGPWQTVRLVLRGGAAVAIAGLGLGLALSFALTRFLERQLYGVKATDPATILAISAAIAFTVFLALYLPARRASRVDPLVALRCE
jgi:putative ABC transport system permease protein